MKIKQLVDCQVAIRRFDTKENIVFNKDTIIEVDEATGNYLLSMKVKDKDNNLQTDFIEVE